MSLSPTLPMIGPDGTAALIPRDQTQNAVNAGAKPAIALRGPDGSQAYVPLENMAAAIKAGAKTEGDYQRSLQSAPAPQPNAAVRFAKGAGSTIVNDVKGLKNLLPSPTLGGVARALFVPGTDSPVYKMLVQPSIDQAKQAIADAQSPDMQTRISSGAHVLAAMLPGIGPLAAQTGEAMRPHVEQGDYAGAAGVLGARGLETYLGAKAGDAVTSRLQSTLNPLPGQNYTAANLKAHTGVLGRLTGLGDNFIPQQSAADTLSPIRQAAADNPQIAAAAISKGSTPNNIAALQAILQKANTALEVPHAATVAQYANVPADVTPIQQAVSSQLPSTLHGVAPEDAAALQELSQRLGTVNTLGGLNDLRTWLNNEASASYKQDGIAAQRGAAVKGAYRAAADAARDTYYDQLQHHSGIDFQPIKSQQAALLSQQEGLAGLGQKLSAQQGIADEPKNLRATAAEAITGGGGVKTGPIEGISKLIAAKVLRQTPLTQPNYLIRKALSNLPEPSPATTPVSAPIPANAGLLPVSASPTTIQGTPVPQPPQLPALAQALLSRGIDPKFLEQIASPGEPSSSTPYPELNAATARTRIQPTQFNTPTPAPDGGVRPVTPAGQVQPSISRFLTAGDLSSTTTNPSTNDLIRAIENMRKRKAK